MANSGFSIVDYVVFSVMLAVSSAIGIYYACTGGKQRTTSEFLLANKKLACFPVSLSIMASFMSAITLLGTPAEVYQFGTQYWAICLCYIIMIPMSIYVYMPVFYNLKLTSAYEYLEMRFSKSVRILGCVTFILQMTLYMALVLYAPSLALNAATGLNLWGVVIGLGLVCTFYTTLGGMKAVVWTDCIQAGIMYSAMFAIVIQGTIDAGGITEVWNIAKERGRIELLDIDPDPGARHTLWTLMIGGAFTSLAVYGVNQAVVQRCCACSSLKTAQLALWANLPSLWLLVTVCVFAGLVIFANYKDCDPVAEGRILRADQLVPLYVMDRLTFLPGLAGLFIAGLFSGTLSTISSGLNSLAAVTLRDLVLPLRHMPDSTATVVSKIIAVCYGVVCIAMAYVASHLGTVLQAALALFGLLGGPVLGVFTLGMLIPWANWKGALAGHLTSLALVLWINVGALITKPSVYHPPVSTAGCPITNTSSPHNATGVNGSYSSVHVNGSWSRSYSILATTTASLPPATPDADYGWGLERFYRLSYLWYSATALVVCLCVGMIVSAATGLEKPSRVEARLMSPLFHFVNHLMPAHRRVILKKNPPDKEEEEQTSPMVAGENGHKTTPVDNKEKLENGNGNDYAHDAVTRL